MPANVFGFHSFHSPPTIDTLEGALSAGQFALGAPLTRSRTFAAFGQQGKNGLVLLSQSVAAFVDRNHIFEKTHFSARGG